MQRLLPFNLSKKFTNSTSPSLLHSHPYKTFTSISKPAHPLFNSSPLSPLHHFPSSCRPRPSLPGKIHGFLSNPSVSKPFFSSLTSTHFRVLSKRLTDSKVGFLRGRFDRGYSSGFNPNLRSNQPGWLPADGMVLGLIMANVAVFMLWRNLDQRFMQNNFTISLDNFSRGRIHTLITHAFSHNDLEHMIVKLYGLYLFGTSHIGRDLGPSFLLKLYLAGAIVGGMFFLAHNFIMAQTLQVWHPSSAPGWVRFQWRLDPFTGLGAGGPVTAIMVLDLFLRPRAALYSPHARRTLNFPFVRKPIPTIFVAIVLIGDDVVKRIFLGHSHVSCSANMGGVGVAMMAFERIAMRRF